MHMDNQMSLFPARASVEIVEQEAISMLPITEANQLLVILRIMENTVLGLKPTKDDH